MTIAIPDLPITDPLCVHVRAIADANGWTVRTASLDEGGRLLLLNSVELALTTPLGYGLGVGKVDYRVIPGPCMALEDYTNAYGIWFPEGGTGLATYSADEPEAFTTLAGRMVMAEKFDVVLAPSPAPADCMIGAVSGTAPTLDLGEEWFDLVESPLPVAIWVARVDADEADLDTVVAAFADERLLERPVSELVPVTSDRMPREGKVLYRWSDDVREGLDAALHTMFYHQILPEIPAIKIYGQD
jgi:hypothetical protein